MISVFDMLNTNFTGNGNAVLLPTKCSHLQIAAGKYDLTITHPVDPAGKWAHIVPEAVIRAPVPEETIETAFSGLEADVYTVNNNGTPMRSAASEPTAITYQEWNGSMYDPTTYAAGDKVTCSGASHRNYQCIYFDGDDARRFVPPYNNADWWTEIADTTSGAAIIVTMKAGTELYFDEDAGSGWYKVCTTYGLEGYVKSSQITYSRHLTPEETQPRVIKEQLFRIKRVARSSDGKSVTATAEHVSYDLNGILIEHADIRQKNPAVALAWIEQAFMMDYRGTIATNMTSDDDGTYTGEIKGKNATYAILDPDKGIVSSFGAMYRRDDWDVFVLRKTQTDRGFRLRYRKNMEGVTWDMRSDSLVTRVVPVAKDTDGSDFYLDDDGAKWVDSPLIASYPVIRMERIKIDGQVGKDDGTETATNWTEQTLRAHMAAKAEERFSVDKADQMIHEITVDFEMLGDTEEYKALKNLESVLMYDTVVCINEEIGLSVSAEVTEIEYDCIRKKITALKLSNVNAYGGKSVTGFQVVNNSITGDKLTDDAGERISGQATDAAKSYTDTQITALQTWVGQNFEPRT